VTTYTPGSAGQRGAAPGAQYWPARGQASGAIGLLHGIKSSSRTWWRVGPELAARGWDVTALDLAGHGDGPRPTGPLDLATLAQAAGTALPAGLRVLVGHSLGAIVALACASRQPALAQGLFLLEPPGPGGVSTVALANSIETEAAAAARDPEGYRQLVQAVHPSWSGPDVDSVVASVQAMDAAAVAQALRGALRWDLGELVRSAPVPVFVAAATGEGTALRGPDRELLQSLLAPGRFVVLEGGHSLQREQPEQVARLISDFARSLAPAPAPVGEQ